MRLSDLEPRFICGACGKRGADGRISTGIGWRWWGIGRRPMVEICTPSKFGPIFGETEPRVLISLARGFLRFSVAFTGLASVLLSSRF
jgi:hypothetical protein